MFKIKTADRLRVADFIVLTAVAAVTLIVIVTPFAR